MLAALVVLIRTLAVICSGHRAVALENVALRQQLAMFRRTVARPQIRPSDRLFWILLANAWRDWRKALMVVKPDTVVRWHRHWLRRRWRQCSTQTRPGRPSTNAAIRTLVNQMGAANPLWGAPRIHGELGKLGIEVSERTVSRLLRRRRRPPSQTWRTFLTNHAVSLASLDFFTVPTLTGRVLFVLVLLSHHRRRIVHVAITEHPTAMWTAQQIIEAFPDDRAPRWLVRDRDAIYNDVFPRRVASMGISEAISSPASPWQNPYAERLIGTIRRECLDHVIVFNQTHLRRTLARYISYYHESRTHLSLAKDAPMPRRVQPPEKGTWSCSRKSADCTIDTNDAQPDVTSSRPRGSRQARQTCERAYANLPARCRQAVAIIRRRALETVAIATENTRAPVLAKDTSSRRPPRECLPRTPPFAAPQTVLASSRVWADFSALLAEASFAVYSVLGCGGRQPLSGVVKFMASQQPVYDVDDLETR